MKIAIVGAGLGGLAAASFLKRDGHDVTVFERDAGLKGRGLGLVVQPLGLSVLNQLGLKDKVAAAGARIERMHVLKIKRNKTISDMRYSDLDPGLFGVGIHRPKLYEILLEKAQALGVAFIPGCAIEDAVLKDGKRQLLDADNNDMGTFDLVVDASGYHSPLRQKYAEITRQKAYGQGFVCGTCEDDHSFSDALEKKLTYRYQGGHAMTLIPVGKDPLTGKDKISFFWSSPACNFGKLEDFDLTAWKKEVLAVLPAAKSYLDQIITPKQLVLAKYADVSLKNYHATSMVFIGDSAHSTSPLLGQSTSMAFTDGLILSTMLKRQPDLQKALAAYSIERKGHVHFQQRNSRTLTRAFQTANVPIKLYRDFWIPRILHFPGMRRLTTLLAARAELSFKYSPLRRKFGI